MDGWKTAPSPSEGKRTFFPSDLKPPRRKLRVNALGHGLASWKAHEMGQAMGMAKAAEPYEAWWHGA